MAYPKPLRAPSPVRVYFYFIGPIKPNICPWSVIRKSPSPVGVYFYSKPTVCEQTALVLFVRQHDNMTTTTTTTTRQQHVVPNPIPRFLCS